MTRKSVQQLVPDTVVWDNHGCMPLRPDDSSFLPQLERYYKSGFDVVTLNVGYDSLPWENCCLMLAQFRHWIRQHSENYILATSVADIGKARQSGRLAICFDIEGGNALNGNVSTVELYYDLGVRWMLIAYNKNNPLGGGCREEDTGLTGFGRQVLDEMARVGMVVCCSHTGHRTAMDVMNHASNPVIFSHSNPYGLVPHPRNIGDDLIRACAETGGVVGINGVGSFLGENDITTETFVRHIEYVAELVGPEHVGLALDYAFDTQEIADYVAANPDLFLPGSAYRNGLKLVPPEQLADILIELKNLGYSDADLGAIAGGNHMRIAQAVWKDAPR